MIWRAFLIWLLIALAEVLNGIVRVRLLNRRVGDRRARQIGVLTGSALILVITWLTLPWLKAGTMQELLSVGLFWLMLMLAFDIGFGRWVFRATWGRIFAEFDVRRGGFLGFGMLVVLLAPLVVAKLRGVW
jgi:hypothetical protein